MKKTKYLLSALIFLLLLFAFACSGNDDSKKNSNVYWTCTMHPQVHENGPGTCPICGMDLIKKVVDSGNVDSSSNDMKSMKGMITLTPKQQILANVSTVKVRMQNLVKELNAYSYLDFVEQSRKTIPAKFNGRIEKLFVDKTGDYIKKDEPLFEVYSPDLVQAQNDYLIALSNSKNANRSFIEASKRKLELLGFTQKQVDDLTNTGKINLTITYYSPVSGTVIEKKVQEGMYVNEGTPIYDVAELSTLWNIAEVNETDLSNVKVGSPVKLKLNAYPGEEFTGKVTFIYPVINSQTRTVKVRSEFSSLNNKLKPQMYGETIFSINAGRGLLVPANSIIFAGERTVVWIKTSDGMFEASEVTVGEKFGHNYQILSGLNEGDEIAATGGFLIDSESQLKTGMPTGHQHGESTTPNEEKKSSSDNMEGMEMQK
jgi:Cu(I)/Ag(I) efflux system membrane fusion protein